MEYLCIFSNLFYLFELLNYLKIYKILINFIYIFYNKIKHKKLFC